MDADKLRLLARQLSDLRMQIFCEDLSGLSPEAEEHYNSALDFLSLARNQFNLAAYRQMKKE